MNQEWSTRMMATWITKHRGWLHYRVRIDNMPVGSFPLIRFRHRTTGTTDYVTINTDGGCPEPLRITRLC